MRKSVLTSSVLALLATACLGEPGANPDSPEGGADIAESVATLTVSGAAAAPGAHALQAGCGYARDTHSLHLTAYSSEPTDRRPRAGLINVWAPRGPGDRAALADGVLAGRFEYNEVRADGTVPTYFGDAEITLRILDDSRERFPLLEIRAAGESHEGVRVELSATCSALVTG